MLFYPPDKRGQVERVNKNSIQRVFSDLKFIRLASNDGSYFEVWAPLDREVKPQEANLIFHLRDHVDIFYPPGTNFGWSENYYFRFMGKWILVDHA